jgi:hypothetical protein
LCNLVDKTSLDKVKNALAKTGRMRGEAASGFIEKLELNCLLNETKVNSVEARKRRLSV